MIDFEKSMGWQERIAGTAFLCCALVSVGTSLAILTVLIAESWHFFEHVGLWHFLTHTTWSPLFANPTYGILPLVGGTLLSSAVGLTIAIPMGLVMAIYLSDFASETTRNWVKPLLELLAGVPTVVFGYFALLVITPSLQSTILPNLQGFNILSAGIAIGLMIIPYVCSLSEDALRSVPMTLREASLALASTKIYTSCRVVFPAALSGIASAVILAFSRAVGETMIVAIAAGQQPNLTWDVTQSAATITAYIVQVALGDLPHASVGYQSIFAAGLTLFVITFTFNILGFWLRKKFREQY